ncbi:efflux RND transporter periplasmic adaptor subunit [Croceitalea sp. MTPC5]|uniref:efflux RND transporter periplasmic adaptor subunit n=1 Tax=Croceitalea sp. MTPC5 TaxID=3056565 RepID=UPI002B3846A0|nr:efflux RND transporter periplasmic adaptor subunit [Croceitalea sp. MTPC5]
MKGKYSILLGVLFITSGILAFTFLNRKEDPATTEAESEPVDLEVKTQLVELIDIPYRIEATGTLQAAEKIELFSEVQGILEKTATPFKMGNKFKKGQVLIALDSKEHEAQIKSSRSDLMNQIAAMLPDMEMDYPNGFRKWEVYLEGLNVNQRTPTLPVFSSNEEKLFVSGKNIYNTYFNIKNGEERLNKYTLRAPFDGIVTESNVRVGTLIRSGQKIGEFVDDSRFELQLSVPASENRYLKRGIAVDLNTVDGLTSFSGNITRINGKINQDTQSIAIVVEVDHNDLKDGEYLLAKIEGDELVDVFSLDNSLILENNHVYAIENEKLQLVPVEILNYQGDMVIVKGLKNGMLLVGEKIANAYPGMPVKPVEG